MAKEKDTFIVQATVEFDSPIDVEKAHDVVYEALSKHMPEGSFARGFSAWRIFEDNRPYSRPETA